MTRNTLIDTATGGGAIALPFWVESLNVVAQEILIIGGVILLILRISLALRAWSRRGGLSPPESRLTMFQSVTTEDIDTVARTVWGEARGEPPEGQQAVAAVIGNRANIAAAWMAHHGMPHPLFGDGHLASACLAHHGGIYQFSCWNHDDPNRAKLIAVTDANQAFTQCQAIARALAAGHLADHTGDATHYLDEATTRKLYGHLPSWVSEMTETTVIGSHTFYRS